MCMYSDVSLSIPTEPAVSPERVCAHACVCALLTLDSQDDAHVEHAGCVLPGAHVFAGVLRRDARNLEDAVPDHVVRRKRRAASGPRDARRREPCSQ